MPDRKAKRSRKQKRFADALWFLLGAVIGLFSLIGLYVVAMNFL